MSSDAVDQLSYHDRLRIQMEFAVPLLRDLQAILGEEVVVDALRERLRRKTEAAEVNAPDEALPMADYLGPIERSFELFGAPSSEHRSSNDGGDPQATLAWEVLASDKDEIAIDVTHCAHAELMQSLDAAELGDLLVCGEDFPMVASTGNHLQRTSTRMLGGDRCRFRFHAGRRVL